MENGGKGNKLQMLKHMIQSGHLSVSPIDVEYFVKDIRTTKYIGSPTNHKISTFVKHTYQFGNFRTF